MKVSRLAISLSMWQEFLTKIYEGHKGILNAKWERAPNTLTDGQDLRSNCKFWWKVDKYAKERFSCTEPLILSVWLDCPWQKIRPGRLHLNHAVYSLVADFIYSCVKSPKLLPVLFPVVIKDTKCSVMFTHSGIMTGQVRLNSGMPLAPWTSKRFQITCTFAVLLPVLLPCRATGKLNMGWNYCTFWNQRVARSL